MTTLWMLIHRENVFGASVIFVGKGEIVLCCAVVEFFNFILGVKVVNFGLKFDDIDCCIKCVIISFINI